MKTYNVQHELNIVWVTVVMAKNEKEAIKTVKEVIGDVKITGVFEVPK